MSANEAAAALDLLREFADRGRAAQAAVDRLDAGKPSPGAANGRAEEGP